MSNCKVSYVLGFLFSPDLAKVVLIRKNRPIYQQGKLNGVGGKVEAGERPIDAMYREFKEETNASIINWHSAGTIEHCDMYTVYCFIAVDGKYTEVISNTDEVVGIYDVCDILELKQIVMGNICVIISMALNGIRGYYAFECYDINGI